MARQPAKTNAVEEHLWAKLEALRRLAKMLESLPDEAPARYVPRNVAVPLAWGALSVLADRSSPTLNRSAYRMILDIVAPTWRETTPAMIWGPDLERDDPLVRRWRLAVFDRDGYACHRCGSGAKLEAHHIKRWAHYPELRVEISNGETLCEACHLAHHHGAPHVAEG